MEMIRIILIEEQPLFREGMCATLRRIESCVVVGASTEVTNILEIARTCNPEVALLSGELTLADPFEIARQMRQIAPHIAILLLTSSPSEEFLFQSIKVGAIGYYTRYITPDKLKEVVKRASRGEYLMTEEVLSQPAIARSIFGLYQEQWKTEERKRESQTPSLLSNREMEILKSMAKGNSNKKVAASLQISDQTVKNHITAILKKLQTPDRTSAVVLAIRKGWLPLNNEDG